MPMHHYLTSVYGGSGVLALSGDGKKCTTVNVSIQSTQTPEVVAMLREAIEYLGGGSYTRTDEDTPERYREAWQAAEKAVIDERAMRKDAEQERDDARTRAALWKEAAREHVKRARTGLSWAEMCEGALSQQTRRAEKAEQALTEIAQGGALTPDDITDEMVLRFLNAYDRLSDGLTGHRSLAYWTAGRVDLAKRSLAAALTEPSRPEGAEKVEAVLNQYWSGDIGGDNLADRIAEEMNR